MNKCPLLVSVEAIQVNDYQQWLPFWLKYQEFYKALGFVDYLYHSSTWAINGFCNLSYQVQRSKLL